MTHPYASLAYAQSLGHWGRAFEVPEWGTCVLVREVEDGLFDAGGTYPFCPIHEKADMVAGLSRLADAGIISATLVLDDFHRPPLDALRPYAPVLNTFKTHYLYRRDLPTPHYDSQHKRALKKAQAQVRVAPVDLKSDWKQWQALYDHLIAELKLSGLHAFPSAHHEALSRLEGFVALGAWEGDELVSAHVWVTDGVYAHSHLVASSPKGYASRAAFAINDYALRYFEKEKLLNFGGGAGLAEDAEDGLARFKRGFSNATANSYLMGIIIDEKRYLQLAAQRGKTGSVYFPAYRTP